MRGRAGEDTRCDQGPTTDPGGTFRNDTGRKTCRCVVAVGLGVGGAVGLGVAVGWRVGHGVAGSTLEWTFATNASWSPPSTTNPNHPSLVAGRPAPLPLSAADRPSPVDVALTVATGLNAVKTAVPGAMVPAIRDASNRRSPASGR